MKQLSILLALCVITYVQITAQDMVSTTRVSQRATVTQRIGTTDITIVYHSPLVKGRKIFGEMVPYNFVVDGKEYPWRTGSNHNTKISFTHDVFVEGERLPAGDYGFHAIVEEQEWVLIFSKVADSWGSFQYDKSKDALRVIVKPQEASFQEWLSYNCVTREPESVTVELRWETTSINFEIATDVTQNILSDLDKKKDKEGTDYLTMATQLLKQDSLQIDSAISLVEKSIELEKTFHNQIFMADLMIMKGEVNSGNKLRNQQLDSAKGFDMYYYGLGHYLLYSKKGEAFKLLSDYVKKKPNDWIAHLALGEYYIKEKQQNMVVAHFQKAYEFAPDNWKNYAQYLYLSKKIILK